MELVLPANSVEGQYLEAEEASSGDRDRLQRVALKVELHQRRQTRERLERGLASH
jgi:hypothetical protein